ncbi:DUF416 family protein [Chamaesiphon polymorphus]|uniref:DUF416 domain-containing protein n=1 Tax=Chamaesiphon polymorphus CCALA 037 TaxID=2107692 RepID=A0A2T1GEJ3_9CYAN|nr:DUF416 family protein [Chamaesiphon polymorphus]PSB55982.1 hypothetical protein C7B77_13330 [Chamaesiphon polymorphus CCALA 037]
MLPKEELTQRYISNFEQFPPIIQRLEVLPRQHQLAFLACCVERMLLNYYLVEGLPGWGEKNILKNAMSQIWKIVRGERLDPKYLNCLKEDVLECDSDPDDYYPISEYFVDDEHNDYCKYCVVGTSSICGIACLLDFSLSDKIEDMLDVFSTMLGALEDYVTIEQNTKYESREDEMKIISAHPAIQLEAEQQQSDLENLEKNPVLNSDLIEKLRLNARNPDLALHKIIEK